MVIGTKSYGTDYRCYVVGWRAREGYERKQVENQFAPLLHCDCLKSFRQQAYGALLPEAVDSVSKPFGKQERRPQLSHIQRVLARRTPAVNFE